MAHFTVNPLSSEATFPSFLHFSFLHFFPFPTLFPFLSFARFPLSLISVSACRGWQSLTSVTLHLYLSHSFSYSFHSSCTFYHRPNLGTILVIWCQSMVVCLLRLLLLLLLTPFSSSFSSFSCCCCFCRLRVAGWSVSRWVGVSGALLHASLLPPPCSHLSCWSPLPPYLSLPSYLSLPLMTFCTSLVFVLFSSSYSQCRFV